MTKEDLKKLSDAEIINLLQSDTCINHVRKAFNNWCAKIEQAEQQRKPLGPIGRRRMEFEAALDIIAAYSKMDY